MAIQFQEILSNGPMVTDGAWGTMMQTLGLPVGECPDAWNITHADRVEIVAKSYVDAGSQIILTNTFGSNRFRLEGHHLENQAVEISKAGGEISCRAAGDKALVFGSIGPSGKMLMMGQIEDSDLEAAFQEQAQALADGGVHALIVETMSDLKEAALAISAAKSTGLSVVACMSFDSGKNKDRTMMGTTPEEAAQALDEAGADAIGMNCGQGIVGYIGICERMKTVTQKPIWVKPNAGIPEMVNGEVVYNDTPEQFSSHIPALLDAGASFVGGCCGTNPDFIKSIIQVVKSR